MPKCTLVKLISLLERFTAVTINKLNNGEEMYSKELIAEVKRVYPDSETMHKLAEDGNVFLGRYLCDSSSGNISIKTVMEANSLANLQEIAIKEKAKIDLYSKWCDEDPRKKRA